MPNVLIQAFKFLGVGIIATLCHYAVLIALVEMRVLSAVPASALGAFVGAVVGYQLNYRFSFEARTPHADTIPRYLLVAAAALCLNTVWMALLDGKLHLPYLVAQIITTGLVFVFTFTAHRAWTFKNNR